MSLIRDDATGAVLIEVIPSGLPSKVFINVRDVGRVQMSVPEQIIALRQAVSILRLQNSGQPGPKP